MDYLRFVKYARAIQGISVNPNFYYFFYYLHAVLIFPESIMMLRCFCYAVALASYCAYRPEMLAPFLCFVVIEISYKIFYNLFNVIRI